MVRKTKRKNISRSGQKGMRNVPYNEYGEVKQKICVALTPSSIEGLDQLAAKDRLPRSEVLERIIREFMGILVSPLDSVNEDDEDKQAWPKHEIVQFY